MGSDMPPRVLFAHQAPTLIDNFAQSHLWRVETIDLGDSDGFDEMKLLKTSKSSTTSGVEWLFVCSPLQLQNAQSLGSKVCWVMHNGKPNPNLVGVINPSNTQAIVCMSERNAAQVRFWYGKDIPVHVLIPGYEPTPVWSWRSNLSWTVKSRPWARDREALELVHSVVIGSKAFNHLWYGQGQPSGFLTPRNKLSIMQSCSCYISSLPRWAGFGLTEHECMAAGVPVVGSRWGDTAQIGPGSLLNDWPKVQEQLATLARSTACPKASEAQLEYIRTYCSPKNRDLSIERFLSA